MSRHMLEISVTVPPLSGGVHGLTCFIPSARRRRRWWTTAMEPTVFRTRLAKREPTQCGCVSKPSMSRYVPPVIQSWKLKEIMERYIFRKHHKRCPDAMTTSLRWLWISGESGEFKQIRPPGGVLSRPTSLQGSPFALTVSRKPRRHSGTFHCCCFCSSGGSKEARCGCPGTMPGGTEPPALIRRSQTLADLLCVCLSGGFQGCGHGHKGHPGKLHWSCCGSTVKNSECLPQSVLDAVSPRSHLRTVEL